MSTLFLRTLAERWRGPAIVVIAVFATTLVTMSAVKGADPTELAVFPEPVLNMLGIPSGADAAALAYGVGLNLIAPLALSAVAIAMGTDIIAGVERRRTLSLVLSTPISRAQVAAAKVLGILTVLLATGVLLLVTTYLANAISGVSPGESHLAQLTLVVTANALLHGAIAYAVGSTTGNEAAAAFIGGTLLTFGWIASGVLPLVPEHANIITYLPYGWFSSQNALIDGIDTGYFLLQLGLALVLFLAGSAWFMHRDMRTVSEISLRRQRQARIAVSRPASIFTMLLRRNKSLLTVASLVMAVLTVLMGKIWDSFTVDVAQLAASVPPNMLVWFGAGDITTPTGYLWGEIFGLLAPIAVIAIGTRVATGLARPEKSGWLGMVLAHPVRRSRIIANLIGVLVASLLIFAVVTAAALLLTTNISTLGLTTAQILGVTGHLFAFGLCLGAISVLVVAATGSRIVTVLTATGLGLVSYLVYAAAVTRGAAASWGRISPLYWYASHQPLDNGMNWVHVVLLLAVALAAFVVAFPLFNRRDIHV
ncbi:MAG: ABC transporter permease subunit [Trueperella sp.]|nr:ABC transporter permease subunit [Trueperella sp.]